MALNPAEQQAELLTVNAERGVFELLTGDAELRQHIDKGNLNGMTLENLPNRLKHRSRYPQGLDVRSGSSHSYWLSAGLSPDSPANGRYSQTRSGKQTARKCTAVPSSNHAINSGGPILAAFVHVLASLAEAAPVPLRPVARPEDTIYQSRPQ